MALHVDALGPIDEVTVHGAPIRYHDSGSGPAVVFVHGLLVNADLWREVVPAVRAAGYRCLAPDWPLGAHSVPVPGADLTPPAVADLIAGFLAELDLDDVTVVANDTGGALTQILLARDRSRVGRVVLTPSDSYERFLPSVFKLLPPLARVPGGVRALSEVMRVPAVQRAAFGLLVQHPLPRALSASWMAPSQRDPAIREDLRRFLAAVDKRHTLEAARSFPQVELPVLLAWARGDRLFPLSDAHRLAAALVNATVATIDDSRTFVPHDQPHQLADLVVEFARRHPAR